MYSSCIWSQPELWSHFVEELNLNTEYVFSCMLPQSTLHHLMLRVRSNRVPVLVAVDNVNAWQHDSPFHDPATKFRV